MMRAPSRAKVVAMPSPKPEPAPVTMAILPASRMVSPPLSSVGWSQPWRMAMVFTVVKPYSASKPFSRPWPDWPVPPKGSSTPPPAP